MHTYLSIRSGERPIPELFGSPFHDVHDVIAYASDDGLFDWRTYPEIWCLAPDGHVVSYCKGSSLVGLRWWAEHPQHLADLRRRPGAPAGPVRWLVNEPRFSWRRDGDPPDERDAAHFLGLRSMLHGYDVELVDWMLWSDDLRCWSLHELTSGTTSYGTRDGTRAA